jgi:hypothetical protein
MLVCCAFVVGFFFVVPLGTSLHDLWQSAVFFAGALILAWAALELLFEIVSPRRLLMIDAEGIVDHNRDGVGRLAWSDVAEVATDLRIRRFGGTGRFLRLRLVRPGSVDAAPARRFPPRWRSRTRVYSDRVEIPLAFLPVSRRELLELVGRYYNGPIDTRLALG